MKKNLVKTFLAICLMLSSVFAFAQQTAEAKTTANFEMRAHSTFGYDFATNQSGIETQIDQMQIWFEIFPYNTYGVNPQSSKGLNVSLRAEGLKYAFKWFDMYRQPTDNLGEAVSDTGRYSEATMNNFACEKVVAEVSWKNYYLTLVNTGNPIWFSSASLKGIFSELAQKTGDENKLGIPFTGLTQDLLKSTKANLDISGSMGIGYRNDMLDISVQAASKGTWKNNPENAWVLGTSAKVKPIENLEIHGNLLSTINYDKVTNFVDFTQFGISTDYQINFSDKYVLKPYIGFDGMIKNNLFTYEIGGGVTFHWRGADYKITHDTLNIWNLKMPVGASLAANIDNDGQINLMLSVLEDSAAGGLVPNFGGFIQFEMRNLTAANNKDARIGFASQIDYKITKKINPYIFGKYVQGYSSGKITKIDDLTTRLGVLFNPAPRFSIDLCYERNDKIGEKQELDKGTFTAKFAIKL